MKKFVYPCLMENIDFHQYDSVDPDVYWAQDHEELGDPNDLPQKLMIYLAHKFIINHYNFFVSDT